MHLVNPLTLPHLWHVAEGYLFCHTHLFVWGWDGNVEVVVLHEGANLATFLADDVAVVLKRDADLPSYWHKILYTQRDKKRMVTLKKYTISVLDSSP